MDKNGAGGAGGGGMREDGGSGDGGGWEVCPLVQHAHLSSQTVRFYDVATNEQKSKYDHRAAVLACCFSDATHAFSGGLDTSVRECVTFPFLQALLRALTCLPAYTD